VVNAGCREKDISHMQKHLDSFSVRTMLGEKRCDHVASKHAYCDNCDGTIAACCAPAG
jgi:hypothetical protein